MFLVDMLCLKTHILEADQKIILAVAGENDKGIFVSGEICYCCYMKIVNKLSLMW